MNLSKDHNDIFRRHHPGGMSPPPLFPTISSQNQASKTKEEQSIGMRDLRAPEESAVYASGPTHFIWVFVNNISKFGVLFYLDQTLNHFQIHRFLFLDVLKKTLVTWATTQRALLTEIERTGPRGRYLGHFSAGEMTLWSVHRQHMHRTAAVMTTLLKGCKNSHHLIQCQVYANLRGGLASCFMLLPI